jgi:hypothetical protein
MDLIIAPSDNQAFHEFGFLCSSLFVECNPCHLSVGAKEGVEKDELVLFGVGRNSSRLGPNEIFVVRNVSGAH